VKSNINSIEVHPPLSNNRHVVGGATMFVGSLWLIIILLETMNLPKKEEREIFIFKLGAKHIH
jgi:hypothetical protein